MTSMKVGLSEKIDDLNAALLREYKNDKKLFEKLTDVQSDLGLLFDDRPTCPLLRPHFLSRSQYSEIVYAAEMIAEAEERLTYAALENDQLRARFDLTEMEERLVKVDPGYNVISNSGRLDTFVSGEDFKFLEYNAETPAGVGDQTPLETVMGNIPLIKDFLKTNNHWRPKPHQMLLRSLFTSYREFGGRKTKPNIAIIDWDGVSTEAEFYILKEYFESMGFRTLVVDPSLVEYNGDQLHAGSFEIDILYKRILIHEFLEKYDDTHPLIRAYEDGKLCLCNSFRTKIPHKKASFAILTDGKYSGLFTDEQSAVIRKHIPWTRKVEEAKTDFRGRKIDLLEYIREKRDKFLLKPNDDYGGKGIVLGWETPQSEWETALDEALTDSFVVQEKADIEKQEFPLFDKEVEMTELLVDFDPFLFQNKVEGGMVRLSSSSLVNVSQGGAQTALIVLEDF